MFHFPADPAQTVFFLFFISQTACPDPGSQIVGETSQWFSALIGITWLLWGPAAKEYCARLTVIFFFIDRSLNYVGPFHLQTKIYRN